MTKLGPICEGPREHTKAKVRKSSAGSRASHPLGFEAPFRAPKRKARSAWRTASIKALNFREMPSNLPPHNSTLTLALDHGFGFWATGQASWIDSTGLDSWAGYLAGSVGIITAPSLP